MEQQEKINLEQLLSEGACIQIKPQGYSMYPLLVPGRDEARIAPIEKRNLKRGDVVLYRRDDNPCYELERMHTGILVLHRIVRVDRNQEQFYLVGDNQKQVEGPLRRDQIRGIMVGVVRKGKYFSCANLFYRFLAGIWLCLRPVRPVIAHGIATIGKGLRGK